MVQMKKVNTEFAQWIEDGKASVHFPIEGGEFVNRVKNIVPAIFESYCKIFHPFEISFEEEDTLTKNEQYGQHRTMLLNRDAQGNLHFYEINAQGEAEDIVKRSEEEQRIWESRKRENVCWRDVAEKYGLVYHNEINPQSFVRRFQQIGWPPNLRFPSEGFLPQEALETFLAVVASHTPSQRVYIYQQAPNTIWRNSEPEELVLCRLDEVKDYFTSGFIGYIYDEERRWIIFNDTDLCFSVVGGARKLIMDLLSSPLEVLECSANTRVDVNSDKVNQFD